MQREGFWSPRTASVDWCEPNYLHSVYVAEWYNTLSSLAVVLMGLTGIALSTIYTMGPSSIVRLPELLMAGIAEPCNKPKDFN